MNDDMKIMREVSIQAENFYSQAVSLGDHAAFALKKEHRAQLTSLESIAESAMKTSDIFDYIKKQIARKDHWRKALPENKDTKNANQGFGERLKTYLEENLRGSLTNVCKSLGIGDTTDQQKQQRREIYLLLIRQFIRQMVAQYEYRVSQGNQGRE